MNKVLKPKLISGNSNVSGEHIENMRNLDETDMEILSMLAENARRPFSDIGEAVGLTGPAVSDRVNRLKETGIINNFTIDVNRSHLRAGVPVFIQVELPPDLLENARDKVRESEGVEHVFLTSEGDLMFYARVESRNVRQWVKGLFEEIEISNYSITLIDEIEWTPTIDGVEFALTCIECGNTVDNEGETARIDGDVYHFCCPSCLTRFQNRYKELEKGV